MSKMSKLSNLDDALPEDVAVKIAEHLQFHEDFMALSAVCRRWRSATKEAKFRGCVPATTTSLLAHDHHHLPWLIMAEPDDDPPHDFVYGLQPHCHHHRRVYNLCSRTFRHLEIPYQQQGEHKAPQGLVFSSRGWLLSISRSATCEVKFLLSSPFSGTLVQLPALEIWSHFESRVVQFDFDLELFEKFTLSYTTPDDDDDGGGGGYGVALFLQDPYMDRADLSDIVVSWKKGQDHWVQLGQLKKTPHPISFKPFLDICCDITFYRGEFHAVDDCGDILAFRPGQSLPRLIARFEHQGVFKPDDYTSKNTFYLVESMGRLLLLCRMKEHASFETISFQIFEVDVENGEAKEVHDLGGNIAIFIGTSSSFSVEASVAHGCKANCIYYTDDYRYLHFSSIYARRDKDCGVYNLTTGKFESLSFGYNIGSSCNVSRFAPAMWLESPSSS